MLNVCILLKMSWTPCLAVVMARPSMRSKSNNNSISDCYAVEMELEGEKRVVFLIFSLKFFYAIVVVANVREVIWCHMIMNSFIVY